MRSRTVVVPAFLLLALGATAVAPTAFDAASVASGYAAKLTCSLSLVSGQDPQRVRADLLERVLVPVAGLVSVRGADCCARADLLGAFGARAVHRRGLGCTLLAGRDEAELSSLPELPPRRVLDPSTPWPDGAAGPTPHDDPAVQAAIDAAIDEAFREVDAPGSGRIRQTKAVVVAHRGRLLAERYADGYSASTPMLSWSMAKSVTADLAGLAVAEGWLELDGPPPVPEWSAPGDPRGAITLDQMLRMSSGLEFDETYGAVNDVSVMLFTQQDTGAYAAAKPLASAPDSAWSYSSGTTNIVARVLRDHFGGDAPAFVRWSREALFDPAGMTSAFFEHDASGTPVGSSFVFMTARDWARFGELHRNGGVSGGRRVLPEGWARYVTTPTPRAPKGQYGAHWWLNAGSPSDAGDRPWPSLPPDAYAARGYTGQWVLVVPSRELVVVRLGIAFPDDGTDGTEALAAAVIAALERGNAVAPPVASPTAADTPR